MNVVVQHFKLIHIEASADQPDSWMYLFTPSLAREVVIMQLVISLYGYFRVFFFCVLNRGGLNLGQHTVQAVLPT